MPHASSPESPSALSFRRVIVALAWADLAVVGCWMTLSLLARLHWIGDMFANTVLVNAVLLLAAVILLLCGRAWRGLVLALLMLSLNLAQLAPYLTWGGEAGERTDGTHRVMLANVLTVNPDKDAFRAAVREYEPDILCIQEVDDAWQAAIESLDDRLPHVKVVSRPDNFGIALASRWPFERIEVLELGDATVPAILATLKTPDGPLTLLDMHTLPPIMRHYAETRDLQLDHAAEIAGRHDARFMVVGDLNVTPWSPVFRDFIETTGLQDPRRGRGILPTFDARARWRTVMPVDHILPTPDLRVERIFRGRPIGSDHLPVIADFRI